MCRVLKIQANRLLHQPQAEAAISVAAVPRFHGATMTQAAQLIQAIRRSRSKGMTYGELEALRISTCPWKRVQESGDKHLREKEVLARKTGRDGLVRFYIHRMGWGA